MEYQPDPEYIRKRREGPCPAVKRDGEVCGSTRISVSGFCFAHDPEAAAWRAKGNETKRKKRQAKRRLREMGTVHLVDALEKSLEGVRSGEVSASDARAMARTADAIFRMMRWAEEDVKKGSEVGWPAEWGPN